MSLPFTLQQFLETFRIYNSAIGLAPVLLVALAISLVALAHGNMHWRHRAVAVGLAGLWAWAGAVYHLTFFARINPAARLFGALFLLQALLFLWFAFRGGFQVSPGAAGSALSGWLLVAYSLIAYPLLGWAQGHGYPDGPSFGAPCPVVIFTFGMLCWTVSRVPLRAVAIPIAWAVIGTSAAVQLGIHEDFGLAVGAFLLVVVLRRGRSKPAMKPKTVTNDFAGRAAPTV